MKATTGKKPRTTGKLEERAFRSHQNSLCPTFVRRIRNHQRSFLLGSDIGNDRPPHSLTNTRACDTPTGQPVRRAGTRITKDDSGALKTNKLVSGKTVIWAEIASLRTTRAGKCPLFLRNLS
jgi:hypothetical protein